ncbi:hypothetical protein ACN47E_009663 [Coniothyrium glycines]
MTSSEIGVSTSEATPSPTVISSSDALSSSVVLSSTAASSSAAPPPAPTIGNPGFDDTLRGTPPTPWVTVGGQVGNDAVFWKRSPANIIYFRGAGSVTQNIDNLDLTKRYRVVFYYVKFDTPIASRVCTLTATIGGQQIFTITFSAPRTPNNVFEQAISSTFVPPSASAPLRIGTDCPAGTTSRSYLDDVSIEEVTAD